MAPESLSTLDDKLRKEGLRPHAIVPETKPEGLLPPIAQLIAKEYTRISILHSDQVFEGSGYTLKTPSYIVYAAQPRTEDGSILLGLCCTVINKDGIADIKHI